ncbi:MAG TPA: hypothetical protein HA257_06330 [Candidatus Methanoperedenaceae archaeon]|nr:hypothetical protein [Candidatus Methanoperedenaceae archaeon]
MKAVNIILCTAIFALLASPAQADVRYLPESWQFSKNFYTVYGEPELDASIAGSREFSRGDEAVILVSIMNSGKITGFKAENTPEDANEIQLAAIEKGYEIQRTLAAGITAELFSDSTEVEVLSGTQFAGSLREGEVTMAPLQFKIKVNRYAGAGVHKLRLNLYYSEQRNAQVAGNATRGDVDVNFWYIPVNITDMLEIRGKDEAEFEVRSESAIAAGSEEAILVTFRNTGEKVAKEAVARISIVDPFSSTDDQSYLGDLAPGEEKTTVFRIGAKGSATPKTYSISTEVKYRDVSGNYQISESRKIPLRVLPASSLFDLITGNVVIILAAVLVIFGAAAYMRMRKG